MAEPEIDEGTGYAGFAEALALVRANTSPVGTEESPLAACPGYVSAEDAHARLDSPSRDASLKDGFAVRVPDVADACRERPAELTLVGSVFAGSRSAGEIHPGETVKVCTGAPMPKGAGAVVASELCDEVDGKVRFRAGAAKGRNVARAGEDVKAGTTVVTEGQLLMPARLAFAAMAGISRLKVYRKPRLAILSIGDELVPPGEPLSEGKIYASNSLSIAGWLALLGIATATATVGDSTGSIKSCLASLSRAADGMITIGGLMHSERDLIFGALNNLGWTPVFHHVRMGPGKGTSFGVWQGKPVFCLSGSPTSSAIAFIELVLPGIANMIGLRDGRLLTATGRLSRRVVGRHRAWAEFHKARLTPHERGYPSVVPLTRASRPASLAEADCLLCKPEGIESLERGQLVTVDLTEPFLRGW